MSKLKRVVPELRFLKHDGSSFPEWEYVPLRLIATMVIKKNKDKKVSRVLTNSASDGIVDQRDYFNKDIAVKDNLDGYYVVNYGDYVYNPRISSLAPVGPISKNKVGLGVMSPLYIIFRFNNKNNDFYEQFFNFSSWYAYLQRIANMGARHDRISIKNSDFMEMPVPKLDDTEQKKISDFLSSIDDLIVANSKKLESLKLHKKGLMQKLFPEEGENKPDFRFPEFSMEANWKKEKLHNLVDLLSGHAFKSEYFSTTGKKMVTPKNFTKNGFASFSKDNTKYTSEDFNERYICREGDLLLLLTDLTPSCELLGRPMLLTSSDGEVLLNQRIAKVILKGNINSNFLKYFFLSNSFRKRIINTATGSTVRHTSNKIVLSTELLLPNLSEQNKIAACLLPIDELIRSQADKIETLKEYKKGLMQQLFPEMKESIA
ncbi:restriction endonuclease subunit S [Vibrio metschnikovii]|uniref:restriction endonuclease subunit S n=1 Tax=Vibrio metschnikovii TaxID=28172 RepID=UPI002FE5090E